MAPTSVLVLAVGAAALAVLASPAAAAPWNAPQVPAPAAAAPDDDVSPPWMHYNQSVEWYTDARVDHFNLTDQRLWRQRYFVIKDFWKNPDGPVLLHSE